MSPAMDPLKYEVHVYWRGATMQRVTVKIGAEEHELEWPITKVSRVGIPGEVPTVDLKLICRLVEHHEEATPK